MFVRRTSISGRRRCGRYCVGGRRNGCACAAPRSIQGCMGRRAPGAGEECDHQRQHETPHGEAKKPSSRGTFKKWFAASRHSRVLVAPPVAPRFGEPLVAGSAVH